MDNRIYRVGIVGASTGIATGVPHPGYGPVRREVIASHTAALELVPRVDLVGICDLLPEVLDQFASNWSDRWPETRRYVDYREMLARENLDVLAVATPDDRHADIVVDGVRAGVKAVLCEKPLATSLEDADRMIQACEENGVVLTVDHTRRFSPLLHTVRESIRSGEIGPLGNIVGHLGGARAMLFRNGTHLIDAMCFFAESEPARVSAVLEDGFDDWDRYKGDGGTLPEKEPGATGVILFSNGVRAVYNGTKNTTRDNSIRLSGPGGMIHFGMLGRFATIESWDADTRTTISRTLTPGAFQAEGLVAAYEELIGLIEKGGTGISSGREARKTVQAMVGFLKSHQAGSRLVEVPS